MLMLRAITRGLSAATIVQPIDDLELSSEGVVVHFHRPDGEWNSIAIGASYHPSVIVEADSMPLGEWRWNSNKNCAIAE